MGIIFDEPKYPVIDKAPGIWKTVSNFSTDDWLTFGGMTAIGFPVGYVAGLRSRVPRQSAVMCAAITGYAGFLLAYQQSSGRLMGLLPNDREVETGLAKKS